MRGALILVVAPFWGLVAAAGPIELTASGRVVDALGQPVSGPQQVTLSLFASASSTEALWVKTYSSLPLESGYYTVPLAIDDTSDAIQPAWLSAGAWLETAVSGVGTLSPRQRLVDVPVAAVARHVAVEGAPAASTCTETGAVVFDTSTGSLRVCDGTEWGEVAGGGGGTPDRFASWTAMKSGDVACTELDGVCLAARNGSGTTIGCGASTASGSADCRGAVADTDGWSYHVTQTVPTSTGRLECARSSGHCVASMRAYDALVTTCDDIRDGQGTSPMVHRCRPATDAADGWHVGIVRSTGTITGNETCAQSGLACKDVVRGNDGIIDHCDSSRGGGAGGAAMAARCRSVVASDQWTTAFTAASGTHSGNTLCAEHDMACVDLVRNDGIHEGCDTSRGAGAASPVVVRCRAKAPSDIWTLVYSAASGTHSGNTLCTENNAVCVDLIRNDGIHEGCNTSRGAGTASVVMVRCRPRVASDIWDTWTAWSSGDSTGNARCSALGGGVTCVDVVRNDGLQGPCTETRGGSSLSPVIARCNLP